MSAQENTDTVKDSGRKPSLLFGLWKKVSGGGKAGKKAPAPEDEESPAIPEGAAPEEPPPPEPTYEETPAPEELLEYFLQFCQEGGKKEERLLVRDFCTGTLPEEKLLKQIFSQLNSKTGAVMKEFRRQARAAALAYRPV